MPATYFRKEGDAFKLTSKNNLNLHERLPVGTYSVAADPSGYFLKTIDPFEISSKLYGDTTSQADRIIRTFLDRVTSTGVMLAGEKGSGKTLLCKCIAVRAATDHQIPTIVVNEPHHGEKFNQFLQLIEQPTVVLFDEFEKVYVQHQSHLLTLLDGTYPSKTLFLFTCNNKWKVSTQMRNRPGRIYYLLEFKGVGQQFVREYCEDNLIRKEQIESVCAISALFQSFNFDTLQALVEEMNRYGEPPAAALKYLNARPDYGGQKEYKVTLTVKGKTMETQYSRQGNCWCGTPLSSVITIQYSVTTPQENTGPTPTELSDSSSSTTDDEMRIPQSLQRRLNRVSGYHQSQGTTQFTPNHLVRFDTSNGTYCFCNPEEDAQLVLKEKKKPAFTLDTNKISTSAHDVDVSDGGVEPGSSSIEINNDTGGRRFLMGHSRRY